MNHFDTARQIIINRISTYTSQYGAKEIEDLVAYQMQSYSIIFLGHKSGKEYKYASTDIDVIVGYLIFLLRSR